MPDTKRETTLPLVVSAEDVKQLLVALGPVIRASGFEVVPERTVTTIIGLLSCPQQDRGASWELEADGVLRVIDPETRGYAHARR